MKFKISHPIEPFIILQGFGVNGQYYRDHGINIKGHNGYDLQAKHGQPVYATHDGVALYEVDANQGHGVVLITNDKYESPVAGEDDCYFKTIYWHFCDPVKEPQFASPLATGGAKNIKKGDLLGYADSTGFSTGDHLHFAVKPVAKTGENLFTWGPMFPDNGYGGCIDPGPYFEVTPAPNDIPPGPVQTVDKQEVEAQLVKTQLTLIDILKKVVADLKEKLRQRGFNV